MKESFLVCKAEILKQVRNYQGSYLHLISLVLWPIIILFTTYFTYMTFDLSQLNEYGIFTNSELLSFLIVGSLGYSCFWSMLESSIYLGKERENGTLEVVFMTPANKLFYLYGRSLGGIFQNIVLFILFSFIIVIINGNISVMSIVLIPVALLILIISSTIWGGFISSFFLLSRDIDILFTICDEPMNFFSGVRMPIQAFPQVLRIISSIFPLTYCLIILRSLFLNNTDMISLTDVFWFVFSLIILFLLTLVILKFAVKRNRETGNLQLY